MKFNMKKSVLRGGVFVVVAVLSTSCLQAASSVDEEKMRGLSAALVKISATVHAAVKYKNPPPDSKDAALLKFATAHNTSLLSALDGYVVKARKIGANSSVLVCDATGQRALVEDAGCTGASDVAIWQVNPNQPCEYVLDLTTTCPAPH